MVEIAGLPLVACSRRQMLAFRCCEVTLPHSLRHDLPALLRLLPLCGGFLD